jgi:hypothetical protein
LFFKKKIDCPLSLIVTTPSSLKSPLNLKMLGDAFWNPTRARNFVVALGGTPTTWPENLAFLAAKGKMTVEQLRLLDPISYAYLVNPIKWGGYSEVGAKVKSILGADNFRNLVWFYVYQDEVAAARVRTSWRMSPTQVYWAAHWHMEGVKMGNRPDQTKEGRHGYVNRALGSVGSDEIASKRPATAAAYNRKTRLPRMY